MKERVGNVLGVLFLIGILTVLSIIAVFGYTFQDTFNGSFNNTAFNGTEIYLIGNNLSGNYTSEIFDATAVANWTGIDFFGYSLQNDYLYAGDVASGVYESANNAIDWSLKTSDYNGADGNGLNDMEKNSSGSLFILNSQDLWSSNNFGVNWTKINDDINGAGDSNSGLYMAVDSNNNLYVIDGSEDILKSNNSGINFTKINGTDFNGANGNVFGFTINRSNSLFAVDSQSDVWKSDNGGVSWVKVNDDYNGAIGNGATDMVINSSNDLFIVYNQKLWGSIDSGVTWTLVNDDLNGGPDSHNSISMAIDYNNDLYVSDGGEDIYKSNNSGINFTLVGGNINGADGDLNGMVSIRRNSNLTFQIRNCSSSCTNELFFGPDGSENSYFTNGSKNFALHGRYFQYRALFQTDYPGLTGFLKNVSINYSILDNSPPNITIYSPANSSYSSSSVFINYSASDSNLASCWYSIDTSINISLPACGTASLSGLSDSSHIIRIYANDSFGNTNFSSVRFSIDASAPNWNSIQSYTPDTYNSDLSIFNVSWSDSNPIQTVLFESNFSGVNTNYSMYLIAGKYQFNASIPAGTFYWKSHANDSFGNLNSSSTQIFTIEKASRSVDLNVNGNVNQNVSLSYGTIANVSANSSGSYTLYRNGVEIVNEYSILGAGNYNYTVISNEDQNYSSSSRNVFVNVSKISAGLNLLINGLAVNSTISYGNFVNISAYENNIGDADVDYTLYKNGVEIVNDYSILGAGNYNYTYNSTDGENYSSYSVSRNLIVQKGTPTINLSINGQENDLTIAYGNFVNISVSGNVNYTLYKNGVEIVNEYSILGAGNYNYTAISNGDENYSSYNITKFVNVSKVSPTANLSLNGEENDISITFGSLLNVNAVLSIPSSGIVELYEDGILNSSGNNFNYNKNYTSLGDKTWKIVYLGNDNYTSQEVTRTVSVLDPSFPQFSNLKDGSGNAYSPGQSYQFNATWIDNVGISEVILNFNGTNYSYSSSQIQKNGDEYYFSVNNLGAGSYNYKWYANDSSGNVVSTTNRILVVEKSISALFLTMSPSNSASYGTSTSVSCLANNLESVLTLTKNAVLISNPDSGVMGAGNYNYACTAVATQNYTSASTTGSLTINKASPRFNLSLNEVENDLTLSSSGGEVNISASIISPNSGIINLSLLNSIISGNDLITNISLFNVIGSYAISVLFDGNSNYSAGYLTRNVIVNSPGTSSGGGSGSGGGGGGGGGGGTQNNNTIIFTGITGLDIKNIPGVLSAPGERKKITIKIKNTGNSFVNNCKVIGKDEYSSWIVSSENKKLGAGEESEFVMSISIPEKTKENNYKIGFSVRCDEIEKTTSINVQVIEKKIDFKLVKTEKAGNKLIVTYSLQNLIDENQKVDLQFVLKDDSNLKAVDFTDSQQIGSNEKREFIKEVDIKNNLEGNFNLVVNINSDKYSSIYQESIIIGRGLGGISGLNIFNVSGDGKGLWIPVMVIGFMIFLVVIGRRILRLRKEVNNHRKLIKAVRVQTVNIK